VMSAIDEQSRQVGRTLALQAIAGDPGPVIVQQANEGKYDVILLPVPDEMPRGKQMDLPAWIPYVLLNARCRVLLIANPVLPTELAE